LTVNDTIQSLMAKGATVLSNFESTILALEKKRKSRIFPIIHGRGEHHLCWSDYNQLVDMRADFSGIDTLEILIHSPGGHANYAYKMANFFRSHCKRLNILIPVEAKSAATFLTLNADSVFMGEFAELGPLDVQIQDPLEKGRHYFAPLNEFKAMEFLREYATDFLDYFSSLLEYRGMSVKQALHEAIPAVSGVMKPLYEHIDPSKVGGYRRNLAEGEEYAKRLLESIGHPNSDRLAQKLVWDYPAHDFVINFEEAKALGLRVQRMDVRLEKLLREAIQGVEDHGLHMCGFVQQPKPKPKQNKKQSANGGGIKKVPAPVPLAQAASGTK
jgi:hypothetical protein